LSFSALRSFPLGNVMPTGRGGAFFGRGSFWRRVPRFCAPHSQLIWPFLFAGARSPTCRCGSLFLLTRSLPGPQPFFFEFSFPVPRSFLSSPEVTAPAWLRISFRFARHNGPFFFFPEFGPYSAPGEPYWLEDEKPNRSLGFLKRSRVLGDPDLSFSFFLPRIWFPFPSKDMPTCPPFSPLDAGQLSPFQGSRASQLGLRIRADSNLFLSPGQNSKASPSFSPMRSC